MKSLTRRLVHAVNGVFGRRGPVLADRYHLRILRTPREVRRALAYVLLNARRHAARRSRGAPSRGPALDPASSGRWFNGWQERPPDRHPTYIPIAKASSWLLTKGYLKHGPIPLLTTPGR